MFGDFIGIYNKMKTCGKCKIPKEVKEFSKNRCKKDGLQVTCKACKKIEGVKDYKKNKEAYLFRSKLQKERNKVLFKEYIKGKCCSKCGDEREYVFDFHHLNPKDKKYNISDVKASGTPKRLKEELKKCIILCSNCHRELHYLERLENEKV